MDNSCEFCPSKFKSLNNLQNHVTKFHENNTQLKRTLCAMSFSNKRILDAHITSVHKKTQNTQSKENQVSQTISRKSTTFEYLTQPINPKNKTKI